MKTPCEVSMWYVVPYVRSQIAITMVNELGMKQSHTARKLGVTDAAVSQYLSGKRAKNSMNEAWLNEEIMKSAQLISKLDDEEKITAEICRVCKRIQDSDVMEELAGSCGRCP